MTQSKFGAAFRASIVPLLILLVCLAGLVAGTMHLFHKDREAVVERFSNERKTQVETLARMVADDFGDVHDDLEYARHLVVAAESQAERERILIALLGNIRGYAAFRLYDGTARETLTALDPREKRELEPDLLEAMDATASRVLEVLDGRIDASASVGRDTGQWYRAFGAELPGERGAIVLLLDTQHYLSDLRMVESDPLTRLLILGPSGRVAPSSSPDLYRRLRDYDGEGEFGDLLTRMREREDGLMTLNGTDAERLGFEPGRIVVAYHPVEMPSGQLWALATLSSLAPIRDHEEAILFRLATIALIIAMLMTGFGAFFVVSSRRRAVLEERLRHAHEIARLNEMSDKILDTIPAGVLVLGDGDVISDVNTALARHLGDVRGLTLGELLADAPAEFRKRVTDELTLARETAQHRSFIVEEMRVFDDEEGTYRLHVVPLEPSSERARILIVVDDFTHIRSLETQLLHAEKLATVGVLTAGIAHEIGTPLGVVRGRAEYILRKLGEDSPHQKGLDIIIEQIDRVSRIIRELLDFARVRPTATDPVAFCDVLARVEELLRYELDRRAVKLVLDVSPDLPEMAANPDQLQQVLVNLIVNASDACEDEGRIEVRAHALGEAMIAFEVSDNGRGIEPEYLHRVFDPFFTTKKRGQGTGLGLSVVSQIVRNHGGAIDIDSEPGAGTRVTVKWPVSAHDVRNKEDHAA